MGGVSMKIEQIFNDIPKFETDRLILRKLSINDDNDMFQYTSNPDVSKYTTWHEHKSLEDTRDFLKRIIKTKAAFSKIATIKPSITMVPSIACNGITAFVFPFFLIPNSTNRINADTMKQKLQMNTILEKKRIG